MIKIPSWTITVIVMLMINMASVGFLTFKSDLTKNIIKCEVINE